ncbi:MAG: SpoIIE family protein phosphatase [Cyclobacteriaceae bacterium]|nr:SpoIIE family protein phosphatase [Cyclobacteriaceae bacterium]MCH8515807.1 SpoIIE family protein phosphatase [Cyclobacteriaceae bacterium]
MKLNCIFILCIFIFLHAFQLGAQDYPFRFYSFEGQSIGSISQVKEAKDGNLLIFSSNGIYSFDSRELHRSLTWPSTTNISKIETVAIFPNEFYILANQNILLFDAESSDLELVVGGVDDFTLSELGMTYLTSDNKLYFKSWDDDSTPISLSSINGQINHLIGYDSLTLITTPTQLYTYSVPKKVNKVEHQLHIKKVSASSNGFFLLSDQTVYRFIGANQIERYANHSFDPNQVVDMKEVANGRFWIFSKDDGAIVVDGGYTFKITQSEGLSIHLVEGLTPTVQGDLWLYSNTDLQFIPLSLTFLHFRPNKHLPGDGKILFATQSGDSLINLYDNSELIKINRLNRIEQTKIPNTQGAIAINQDYLALQYNQKKGLFVKDRKGKVNLSISSQPSLIKLLKNKWFFLGDDNVLWCYDIIKREFLNLGIQVKSNMHWSVMGDRIYCESKDNLVFQISADNLSKESLFPTRTRTQALRALSSSKFISLSPSNELNLHFDSQTKLIVTDNKIKSKPHFFEVYDNSIWIQTESNLFVISYRLVEEEIELTTEFVFNNRAFDIDPQLKGVFTKFDGSYWLIGNRKIHVFNSFEVLADLKKPKVILDELVVEDGEGFTALEDVLLGDTINLSTDQQLIKMKFYPNYFGITQAPELSFSLNGATYQTSKTGNFIAVSNLPFGLSRLAVRYTSAEGVVSDEYLLHINRSRPFYQEYWFLGLLLLIIIFFLILLLRALNSYRTKSSREAQVKYERELAKLERRSHEQILESENLRQVNQLINAQKTELQDKNRQIEAQKYELSITGEQVKKQKDLIEITTEKLQGSINYAKRIQQALMGAEESIITEFDDAFVFFIPRDQVSGDFFWSAKVINDEGDDIFIIAAVDCTGHGVPGSIVSVVGIQLLNTIVKAKGIIDPGQILTSLDHDLLETVRYEETKINDGMDLCLCTINKTKKTIHYAGAKNPLFYLKDGELHTIKGDKSPIGGQKRKKLEAFTTHRVPFNQGDEIVLYLASDGYQDQFGGPENFKFLVKSFKELLVEIHKSPMIYQKQVLQDRLDDWMMGEYPQTDDILVVGCKINDNTFESR